MNERMKKQESKPGAAEVMSSVRSHEAVMDKKSLMSKAVRVGSADLDKVLATLRMTEDNKRRARAVLVEGRVMREVAREDGVSAELVSSVIRRVRAALNNKLGAWTFVTVQLTLPLALAEELRGLSEGLARSNDEGRAREVLEGVVKQVALAKVQVLYGDVL